MLYSIRKDKLKQAGFFYLFYFLAMLLGVLVGLLFDRSGNITLRLLQLSLAEFCSSSTLRK